MKALLSLLQPLDRFRTPSAIGGAIGRPYSTAARGAEQEGRNPAQGSRGFGAPERPRNSTPRFSNSGSRKPLPRGPLEPQKGSQGLGGGSSEASERGVRFQRSGKTRWATQRPLRGPVFPDGPGRGSNPRVPTLGPQITYVALSRIHAQVGALNHLILNRLGGSTAL